MFGHVLPRHCRPSDSELLGACLGILPTLPAVVGPVEIDHGVIPRAMRPLSYPDPPAIDHRPNVHLDLVNARGDLESNENRTIGRAAEQQMSACRPLKASRPLVAEAVTRSE